VEVAWLTTDTPANDKCLAQDKLHRPLDATGRSGNDSGVALGAVLTCQFGGAAPHERSRAIRSEWQRTATDPCLKLSAGAPNDFLVSIDLQSPMTAGEPDPVWHAVPPEPVLRHFELDPQLGLNADTVRRAQARHGPNALPESPPKPLWRTFARQFKSPLIYILFVAAVLAVALGHQGDALVILAVVVVNALIGSFQEGRAERSMAALRRLAALHVRVLRSGGELVVEARELVPGDVMLLAAGDAIAADARLVEEAQLQAAEAALTGESVPVSKSVAAVPEATGLADRRCMVYSGTHVTAGRARAVVVATGTHTEVGRIAGLTERAEEPKTPLELRLEQFGRALVAAALGLFVLVVGDNEDLREALDLDSMDFLNFIIGLSQRSGRSIAETDYPKLFTLRGLVAYLAA
jgi:magnesium-transporting ATPase (P-type)